MDQAWLNDFKRKRKAAQLHVAKLQGEAAWKPLPVVHSQEFQTELQSAKQAVVELESDAILELLQQTAADISHIIEEKRCCTWNFRSPEDHYDYHFQEQEYQRLVSECKDVVYEQMLYGKSQEEADVFVVNKCNRLK